MKTRLLLLAFVLLGFATTFTSCKKEETTGTLTVKIKLEGSTGYLQDVFVGLATSQNDLDNADYLDYLLTDSDGEANFGELNPETYYYDCLHSIGSDVYYGEGQIQVQAGEDHELTLTLTP